MNPDLWERQALKRCRADESLIVSTWTTFFPVTALLREVKDASA